MRDLGVLCDEKLQFSNHAYNKVHKSYYAGPNERNLEHFDSHTLAQLYKSLVRSNLQSSSSLYWYI